MKFSDPLSPEDLYWIGYLRADGLIYKRTYSTIVGLAQKNEQPVNAFKDYVGAENAVRYIDRQSNYGRNILFEIRTAKYGPRLMELGVKTELRADIYQSRHFWRGLCDGDGSVTWIRNRYLWYPAIAWSGSEHDMTQLSYWIAEKLGCKPPKVGANRSIFRVGLNGKKAVALVDLIYKDQYSALEYKSTIAKEILSGQRTR